MKILKKYLLFLLIPILIFTTIYFIEPHYTYQSNKLKTSNQILQNPYIGFYKLNGYILNDANSLQEAQQFAAQACKNNPYSLALLEINLRNYSQQSLSENALNQLQEIFRIYQKNNKQIILRFLYSWDNDALQAEPTSIETIQKHMTQISQPVNTYKNTIYILQGLFIGNDGEMHDTNYASKKDMQLLANHLNNCIDSSIFLSVRTPVMRRILLQTASTKTSSLLSKRLSLFNDGLLGSIYDLGTYSDTPYTKYSDKGTRQQEIDYQNRVCQYIPNGGEVTIDNPYNDIQNAVKDLRRMHISYLNDEHDLDVLNKWKASIYKNQNGYQYIQTHLGYRYHIENSKLKKDTILFTIKNTGFSNNYTPFTMQAYIKTNSKKYIIKRFNIKATHIYSIPLKNIPRGTHSIYIEMIDTKTKQCIHFANKGYETKAFVKIGKVTK